MLKGILLVIDDESNIRNVIRRIFKNREIEIIDTDTGETGLELLRDNPVDVLLTDLRLPGINGIDVLKKAKEMDSSIEVILMTAFGSIDSAVEAMKFGAFDYLTKPFESLDRVANTVSLALERRFLKKRNTELEMEIQRRYTFENIVGTSKKMQEIFRIVDAVADTNATVLIEGESGTGKELVARTIHWRSKRRGGPFVPVDCTSLPKDLIESELFGHEKGAFTGAHVSTKGLFRMADGGTIFLDEIGELPIGVQSKLLRVLEERIVRPVGATQSHPVSVRVVAATNRNLESVMNEQEFRKDLYYRLNVVNIKLPPLRERRDDIPLLVDFFLREMRKDESKSAIEGLTSDAMDALVNYSWPGNVRELGNMIERCFVLCRGPNISLQDLPQVIQSQSTPQPAHQAPEHQAALDPSLSLDAYERTCILKALESSGNNVIKAAELLNISRSTLYRKIKMLSLKIP